MAIFGSKTIVEKKGHIVSNSDKAVFALVTFYKSPDELRFKLACNTIKSATDAGHAVVVVDDSPLHGQFREIFEGLGAQVFTQSLRGLGVAKRQSFQLAFEVAKQGGYAGILADEAEKDMAQFVPEILGAFHRTQPSHVVVPARSMQSWNSYPTFQSKSEIEGNQVFNRVTNTSGIDVFFGPVFFTLDAAEHFLAQNPTKFGFIDTYAQHFGVMLALEDPCCEVHTTKVDFIYPPEQRAEEEGAMNQAMLDKRANQLKTLTESYRNAGRILFGYEK